MKDENSFLMLALDFDDNENAITNVLANAYQVVWISLSFEF